MDNTKLQEWSKDEIGLVIKEYLKENLVMAIDPTVCGHGFEIQLFLDGEMICSDFVWI